MRWHRDMSSDDPLAEFASRGTVTLFRTEPTGNEMYPVRLRCTLPNSSYNAGVYATSIHAKQAAARIWDDWKSEVGLMEPDECPHCKALHETDGVSECIGCGYCCSSVPCAFGREAEGGGCAEQVFRDGRYWCGIADEIRKDPSSCISPAFGAGCCSSLNSVRQEKLRAR